MDVEAITVRCACGWETSGPEDVVVEATRDHGRRIHNMTPTREEVLAMAVAPPIARTALRRSPTEAVSAVELELARPTGGRASRARGNPRGRGL